MSSQLRASPVPDPRRWWALGLLSAAQFLLILDTSIIGVALPAIKDALGFSTVGLQWVFNAYVIAFGVMLLAIAKDPVRYGPLVYVAALLGAIRIAERLIFAAELKQAFGIGFDRTIVTAIIVLALNGGLILLKPRERNPVASA